MKTIAERLAEEVKPIRLHLPGIKKEFSERGGMPKFPISTLPELNEKIWGLHKGLTVIGARSSMGKSSFALQVARDFVDQKIPTLFLSLEMDVNSLIERLFCQLMKVDNFEMTCGRINHDTEIQKKWEAFELFIQRVPLLITNGIGKSFAEVNTLINALNPKPRCVIVDYIQGIKQSERERSELNEYIRSFRQLMLENNMVGILASQVNRQIVDNNDRKPTLENLKSTGVLEEHADMVLLLYWSYFYSRKEEERNRYEVIVAKNRNGKTGVHNVMYYPEHYLFEEVTIPQPAKDIFGGEAV